LIDHLSLSSTTAAPGSEIANYNYSYIPYVFPTGIAVDKAAGNIYVADANVGVWVLAGITSVSPAAGTILATFNDAAGGCIALDDDGNMYVGHSGDTPGGADPPHVIVVASLSSTAATPGSVLYSFVDTTNPLSSPFGIALDSFGRIYVSDAYAYRVAVLNGIKSSAPGTEIT
jgi:DNA-binding beta-propeller fold protein YncE